MPSNTRTRMAVLTSWYEFAFPLWEKRNNRFICKIKMRCGKFTFLSKSFFFQISYFKFNI